VAVPALTTIYQALGRYTLATTFERRQAL